MKLPFIRRTNGPISLSSSRLANLSVVKSRVGRSISWTGALLRRQLWIFPIIAMLVLITLGYFLRSAIQQAMQENIRAQLITLRDVEVLTLTNWLTMQASTAETIANDLRVRELVYELLDAAEPALNGNNAAPKPPVLARLKKELMPRLASHEYQTYMVVSQSGRILAAEDDSMIGLTDYAAILDPYLRRIESGETVVVPPYPSKTVMRDNLGQLRTGVPVMMVLTPLRDANFQPIATLGLSLPPDRGFTQILQQARIGTSGETYAFDSSGRMVSNSRFDEELMLLGLIADEPGSQSILNVLLRDPGGNLEEGFQPTKRRSELPLIKPVVEALAGRNGSDVVGYRDYLGVPSVGAWTYLPKYEMGLITTMDRAEAYRPLAILPYTFWALLTLLAISAGAIFVFSLINTRLQREAQQAVLETKKLGQYHLEDKLGSGGMGVVYRARHAILRRPTAIKMLQPDRITDASINRFEREVQLTCQLNHPNTVQVYDYGRTPEGLFFYAMEFLNGIDLQKLVETYGPQPEGRVIRILTQICGSLNEAHSLGMVHRDIKPANVMLTRRGGEPDVAKVLDFGLVKAIDDERQGQLSSVDSLTGTPLYMSPEAIQTPNAVDSRSDLYSVGAVGYFLLTGRAVFEATNIVNLCRMHVSDPPIPPSQRLGKPVSPELEEALLSCLEKPRSKRPQTARDLAVLLAKAPTANSWSVDDSDIWWNRFDREQLLPSEQRTRVPTATTDHTAQTFVTN